MQKIISPTGRFDAGISVPGDKSVSHRALLLAALARGRTTIRNISPCEDVKSTLRCLRRLGVIVSTVNRQARVEGRGLDGLSPARGLLEAGNSATTLRLLMGILAGQRFESVLTGDPSLHRRSMERVAGPLRQMGAEVFTGKEGGAPVRIRGGSLGAIDYSSPVASAQVKSAVLLAGLFAKGKTILREPVPSRDHTERLMRHLGLSVFSSAFGEGLPLPDKSKDGGLSSGNAISLEGRQEMTGRVIPVPGDISAAAFWIAAACLIPGSSVRIQGVMLNPGRMGFVKVLERMGAFIKVKRDKEVFEPTGTIEVRHAPLKGAYVEPCEIPLLIDEIPLLMVLAARSNGETVIRGAGELRLKESDRIDSMAKVLKSLGVEMDVAGDTIVIRGPQTFHGAGIETYQDHRIAMAASIAALIAKGETVIYGSECVKSSYPGFFDALDTLVHG